ncbi:MAG: Rhomboid protease GluP [candidate division WS6 bacterium OLB20]|uniref:Rhomboid protease GluP n=1 Tax=candidate division WS6 bacterium OLB20 TaxID=1617426 RepID=A0A136LZ64_9BACT|nr:MAG: Rhomboid protease GluP [candidate division WS6 bacterium OLB20]
MPNWSIYIKLTHVLIAVNVILYVLVELLALTTGTNTVYMLYRFGAEHFISIVREGEIWRLVLPAFLHGGFLHLAINMWALYNVGGLIEDFYGARKLFLVYVLSGVSASVLSVGVTFFTFVSQGMPVPADYNVISIGASGAIFGLVGLLLGHMYKRDDYSSKIPIDTSGLWFFVLINVIFGFGGNAIGAFGINNAAHIGGLIGGIVLGLLLSTVNASYVPKPMRILEHLLFALSVLLVVLSVVLHLFFSS